MKTKTFKSALLRVCLASSMAITSSALAHDTQDEKDVKAAVQGMWDAMVTSDGDAFGARHGAFALELDPLIGDRMWWCP